MSEKFKTLSFTAKIQYIWEFYKLRILLFIVVFAFAATLITRWVTTPDSSIYCLVFNDIENEELQKHIQEKYSEYIGCKPENVWVDLDYNFRESEEDGYNHIDEGSSIKFLRAQSTKEMDVILTDYNSMLWAKNEGFLSEVQDVLPKQLYDKLEPYFVYEVSNHDSDKQKEIVWGVDISQTDFYKGYDKKYKEAIIAFPTCSENVAAAIDFVKFIYEIK